LEMIGRLIGGRYRLIAPLGEGGMATLWRAVDEQLDREVAVKRLREQFSRDSGFAARFKQEARSAGSLAHPNIVPVYDYGTEDADQTQFIVMQLVEGQDLAGILHERTFLGTDDAVRVTLGVASALEAAHRRGIVHRDVKPGNILITDDGDVKVTDFGIARAVSEASMTVTGTTLGSVHYFSPEQARGDEVTGRSDVYALGIVLYEMLTGRRPFEGDSAAGVALKRLTEDPPLPSTFRPVPAGLEAIVMRALEREPADRFPDAGSFAEALRLWQKNPDAVPPGVAAAGQRMPAAPIPASGEPTVYVPPRVARPSDRAGVPPRRPPPAYEEKRGQPWWVWLLAVLAILLLGAIGFLGAQILGDLGPGSTPLPSATTFALPNWVGDPIAQVREEADRLGLDRTERREQSEDVPRGRVISTDPAAGTPMQEGDPVEILISGGPREVLVPTLLGQTADQAAATLQAADLQLGNVTSEPSTRPVDTVIRTDPGAGLPVSPGTQVDIVLSSGPTPSPVPTASPTPEPTLPPSPSPSASAPAPS
jgi:hypothetical protein